MLILKTPPDGPYDTLIRWAVGVPFVLLLVTGAAFLAWVCLSQIVGPQTLPDRRGQPTQIVLTLPLIFGVAGGLLYALYLLLGGGIE